MAETLVETTVVVDGNDSPVVATEGNEVVIYASAEVKISIQREHAMDWLATASTKVATAIACS